jgi:hypothetical protein
MSAIMLASARPNPSWIFWVYIWSVLLLRTLELNWTFATQLLREPRMSQKPNPYQQPPGSSFQSGPQVNQGDATGGVIPYKNPMALIGYYLGFGSLLPLIGIIFTIPAIVLGFIGLSKYKQNPVIKGQVHAWIAIIFGFLGLLGSGSCFLFIILGPLLNG